MHTVTALPPTPRELFLAAAIAGMMLCGLVSFFLLGRAAERTHVALALLAVLVGAFALLPLFAFVGSQAPVLGAALLLGLVGVFKLMNQFEIRPKPKEQR